MDPEVTAVVDITAIVFDTNVFGKNADLDIALIRAWAAACSRGGARLWVPEVVLWEIAEHTQRIEAQHLNSLRAYNKSLSRWGLDVVTMPAPRTLNEIKLKVQAAGATIVPLPQGAAVAALSDQILQTGPGSRKGEVKTGAADSAWLRSIYEFNDDTFEGLIVVSGDKAAIEAIEEELDEEIQHVDALRHIDQLLEPSVLAPEELPRLQAAVQRALEDGDIVDTEWDWVFDEVIALASDELPDVAEKQWQYQHGDEHEFFELEVDSPSMEPWSRALTAEAKVNVSTSDAYARQNFWGDAPEYVTIASSAALTMSVQALPDGNDLVVTEMRVTKIEPLDATATVTA